MNDDAFDLVIKAIVLVVLVTGATLGVIITTGFISAVGCF